MGIDLVIFDCDGVVIDSEVISAAMLIAELRGHGVDIDLDFVARRFLGRSYPTVLAEVRETFGIVLPDQFETDYRARLLEAFASDLTEMHGVRRVLERLALPYCLATSSSPERVARSLQLTRLGGYFDGTIFTASRVARGKPAPDLFLLTAREMRADPARCLVIEDSLNGVRAGLAAGMQVWRFMGGSHLKGRDDGPDDSGAHRVFDDFDRFPDLAPALFRPRFAAGGS